MVHEQLDIAHWKQVFSVARMRAEGQKPEDFNITGPRSIAVIEQLREETFASLPGIERVPTDIFILNLGEPEQRAVTKVGGLPYRAAGKPWPTALSGVPMTFVAQFCFVDSRDLVPPLPGDILLVFIEGKEVQLTSQVSGRRNIFYEFITGYGDSRDSTVVFEWVSLEDYPLTTLEEMPETPWKIIPFYGTLYRTWDYPNADGFAYPEVAEDVATTLEAMKIGGMYPSPWIPQSDLGSYLCTLNSIFSYQPIYPFLNVPELISAEKWRSMPGELLQIGDMGLMNIFLGTDGCVRWAVDG